MKCSQENCDEQATHRFMWTDGWHDACEPHAQKGQSIGNAMGLYVQIEPLEPSRN
jgi:hypothetical protein